MSEDDKAAAPARGIYAAIPQAMRQIKRIAKDGKSDDCKYKFAKIDDFLAMTGPIMAEAGLFITMDEHSIEAFERQGQRGPTHWLSVTFLITLWHESGEHLEPVRRTVEVLRTGAQSFGAAQSYALKQFQRAIFCIPTGDKEDADYGEKGEGPVTQDPHARRSAAQMPENHSGEGDEPPAKGPNAPEPPAPPAAPPPEAIERVCAALAGAETLDSLRTIFTSLPRVMRATPAVIEAKDARKEELVAAAAKSGAKPEAQPESVDDLNGDEIPY